ncbi:transcriptional regulator, TetR family [Enhydrobacter aerosaccus]|uniref:Transcriptional regulator, TetR family n=1 Tax=Enhydrobacter aerosaccus TaxID=225324 RepID=A0A1T4N699_9HYPH|nr:TetR/AcrR family transcriptional regulator [Enhydrobacter aerosaccus]SJZ74742.1 transcriptional regulator, TetR family [Enhydrobacter aerosaccus]
MPTEGKTSPPKKRRNAEVTRARILSVARAEFVANGFAGARIERIAATSGVNNNLIYHYFDSKEALYLAVIEQIYIDLRSYQKDTDLRALSPVDALRQLVISTYDHFVATPDMIRLMSVENIHNASHLKKSRRVKPLYRGLLDTLEDILDRGKADGSFRSDIDAIDLYLSISGLAYFFLSNQHTLSWLLDRKLVTRDRVSVRRKHVVDMVLTYVRKGSRRGT